MNPRESLIRDRLAENLEVIEKGLILCSKEMQISNPYGADGRIDLFAEDCWGNKVIIELKRSNNAAREAVQEVLKYTELLRIQRGLKDSQIRVIFLSTDWHELLVPFSALIRDVKFPCEGHRIKVDARGNITSISRIEALAEPQLLDFIPHHMVYCFSKEADRDLQISVLSQKLQQRGVKDFVFFLLKYIGSNSNVFTPFALYACLGTLSVEQARALFLSLGVMAEVQEYEKNKEENEFDFFQHQVTEQVFGGISISCDDFGIGYPEKAGHMANDWELRSVRRFGRWEGSGDVYSDSDLWEQIAAYVGTNVLTFRRKSSPRFVAAWEECKTQAENALTGYSQWRGVYISYLKDIEDKHPAGSVSISIFNPVDFFLQLYSFVNKQELGYLPHFEIHVDDPQNSYKSIAVSSWLWDGVTKPPNVKEFLTNMFGSPFEYLMCRHLGMLDQCYEQILSAHGFHMPILEFQEILNNDHASFRLVAEKEKLVRISHPADEPLGCNLLQFFEANPNYLRELREFVQENAVGFD